MWLVDLNYNFECDWLVGLSDNKLSDNKVSDNKLLTTRMDLRYSPSTELDVAEISVIGITL